VTTFVPEVHRIAVSPIFYALRPPCGEYALAAPTLINTDPVRRRRDRHACPPDTPGKTRQDRGSGGRVHVAGKSLAA
jgi:hypothetical protein